MISVEVAQGREALDHLTEEWEALLGDSFAAVFSHPSWYRAWLEAFPVRRPAALTARAAGRLIGVLPLARARTNASGLYFTRVAPWARADYQPPIIAAEFVAEALPSMLEAARRHFGRGGTWWWPDIPEGDPSLPVLRSFFRAHRMPFVEERNVCPRLRLEAGSDYHVLERQWSASHRGDVRRQRKLLAAQGPLALWQPSTPDEAKALLEEFFGVHDEKWLSQGYPGRFQDEAQRAHFRAVLRHMWGRGLHFSTLRCGETTVSYLFGFLSGGWLQSYRPTYRPEFGRFSPGKVHMAFLVEEACRQGWKGVDLLQGDDPYKRAWSNEILEVISFHAASHPWVPSYWWFTRGKPFVRGRFQRPQMRLTAWLQKRKLGA